MVPKSGSRVVKASLGGDAGIVGAASLALIRERDVEGSLRKA